MIQATNLSPVGGLEFIEKSYFMPGVIKAIFVSWRNSLPGSNGSQGKTAGRKRELVAIALSNILDPAMPEAQTPLTNSSSVLQSGVLFLSLFFL